MNPNAAQWEYCQLVFVGALVPLSRPGPRVMTPDEDDPRRGISHRAQGAPPTPSAESHFHVEVVYAGPDGAVTSRQLTTYEQVWQQNPFYQAIGVLGGAGWELVAIEPARDWAWNVDMREVVPYAAGIRPMGRAAHFKRQVMPGRRVDEPPITLREQ